MKKNKILSEFLRRNNLTNKFYMNRLSDKCSSSMKYICGDEAIACAFDWNSKKEGVLYWGKVNRRYNKFYNKYSVNRKLL